MVSSDTSRPRQAGERDGVDFHFYDSKSAMQADITTGKFLDVVIQSDQFYATAIQSIVDVLQSGRICILDVSIKNIYRLQVRVSPFRSLFKYVLRTAMFIQSRTY